MWTIDCYLIICSSDDSLSLKGYKVSTLVGEGLSKADLNCLHLTKIVIKQTCWQRSTVKTANKKLISFMSFEIFIYRVFQVWAWPLLDKLSTSKKYALGLTDSVYKLVIWCVGHVVLVNNPTYLGHI